MKQLLVFLILALLSSCTKPTVVMSWRDYIGLWIFGISAAILILAYLLTALYEYLSSEIKKWRGGKTNA